MTSSVVERSSTDSEVAPVGQPPRDDGPMSDVDLPKIGAPATRALASIGITRLDDVAGQSQADLLGLHGFGPRALRILNDALAAHGQSMRP